jgi:DNA excision repair protein ERCC-2
VAQTGDIHFRFSSRSSGIEGVRGHQKLQKARGDNYLAEQSVSDELDYGEFTLQLTGRADGCWPDPNEFTVEEIKTIKVAPEEIPTQVTRLHWAQVKVYGYLLGRVHGVSEVNLRLTYYHLELEQEFSFDDHWSMADLSAEYQNMVLAYADFVREVMVWRASRNTTIPALTLPFGEFRPGQREMAVSVYRALANESQVVLQAPTGIGKTIGSLFPAVKAMERQGFDRVFYLSAKTSGQKMAQDAIAQLRTNGLALRDVALTAKDKICFNPGTPCDPDYCQYAKGYYDKIPGVIRSVQQVSQTFDREAIESLALANGVCPFELSLDLTDIADLVIADYNYVFDPGVYLRRHFDEPQKYALLMDESHNLVDRGRDMFSAGLQKEAILELRRELGDSAPGIKTALNAVNREMLKLSKDVTSSLSVDQFPESLDRALRRFILAAEAWLDDHQGGEFHAHLLQLYFDVLRFTRVAEQADENYAAIIEKSPGKTLLRWYCVNPATRLAEGFARLSSSVCFSATLTPQNYYKSLLGVSEEADWYQLASPFDPANLGVFATSFLSTTYHNRQASLYDLVDTLATVVEAHSGNYIAFFPSYAYLNMVYEKFSERYPEYHLVLQQTRMDEAARAEFLAAFDDTQQASLGFAVMGGVFGEGIDLKGDKLIGVIVIGVGMPQIGVERDLIKQHFDGEGQGFEYAYQYPGMNRVLQTAGRVIRSETDRGVVCLIDHRFNEARYRELMPDHWQVSLAKNQNQLALALQKFWRQQSD